MKIAAMIALALAACDVNPFDLNGRGPAVPDAGADGDGGTGDGNATTPDAEVCVPRGPDNTCNELDDDCNGTIDDDFDKQQDPANCGTCGNRCTAPNAQVQCVTGACQFIDCLPGFVDLDPNTPGCEYACPIFPPGSEDCNGVDEDCDGAIDEAVDLPAPPQGQCRATANTPCAGTAMVCATRGGVTAWYCDYAPAVEFDPSVPNGILLHEQRCDGQDGDCDGAPDDEFTDLGQSCDNGAEGVCRDLGVRQCDPADATTTYCNLAVLPDPAGGPTSETCNGLDDDCNGTVDDATGPGRVIDAMAPVTVGAATIYVDVYEAAHPDALANDAGLATDRACSIPGVLPWRGATYAGAAAACAAAGKRLCTSAEWQGACAGSPASAYPYGDDFSAAACNTELYDGLPGGVDDDVLVPTGAMACTSDAGILDLSGNLKEWTNDLTGVTADGTSIAVLRGGAYDTPAIGATCDFRTSRAAVDTVLPTIGFRCCKDTAP